MNTTTEESMKGGQLSTIILQTITIIITGITVILNLILKIKHNRLEIVNAQQSKKLEEIH